MRTPVVCSLPLAADELLRALLFLEARHGLRILDSGGARGLDARFLIAGFDPFEIVEAYGDELCLWFRRRDYLTDESSVGANESQSIRVEHGSVLALLDERLARYSSDVSREPYQQYPLPAYGACIATFSYDLGRRLARPRASQIFRHAQTSEPDATLAFYDTLVIHDYARGETRITSVAGQKRLDEACATISSALISAQAQASRKTPLTSATVAVKRDAQPGHAFPTRSPSSLEGSVTSNFTRSEYTEAVRRIKEHIYAGDIYQANLTQQFTCLPGPGVTPESIFTSLRRDHPASFAAFIRRHADTVIGASPERFLRVEAPGSDVAGASRRVEAWPIKGTCPRGASVEEDARLRAELQGSAKDRAENVMIVDLLRNDLGRVCRYGSIEVTELCTIQEHPTLFHLVSKVRGVLRGEVTAGDLLRAAFPCGSITGAPKLRAMEIIDEVEPAARGLSMGAIGYFSFDGALDLSVAIRTMTLHHDGIARFNVGGGIVADSDPALEYEESLLKARALLRALRVEIKSVRSE